METKAILIILSLFSNLPLMEGQTIEYILRLNEPEPFRGSRQVLETKATLTKFNTDFLKKTCTVFRYDSLHRQVSRYFYKGKRCLVRDTFIYDDSAGRRKTAILSNGNYIENYIYDSLGFLIKIRGLQNGDSLETSITNTLQGFPSLTVRYDQDGKTDYGIEEAEYLLDQNRYILKRQSLMHGTMLRDTLVLNPLKRADYPAPGETFNDRGDPINIPKLAMTYKYRYDEYGNWIKINCFGILEKTGFLKKRGKFKWGLQSIWKRKISYKSQP